jgi:FkbM family methyltransferase
LGGRKFSLTAFEMGSNLRRAIPELRTIIDAGANSGQFSKAAAHFFPEAKISAFEPLPDLYPVIERKFHKNPNIATYNLALGNENGSISFNRNKYGHISSIMEISDANIHYPKQHEDVERIDVAIKRLDDIIAAQSLARPALLKLDVQGYEMEVLKGADLVLTQLDFIVIEANLEQLYKGQASFTEMNAFLNSKGFEVEAMLDFSLGKGNKYIEIDLLYKRR